MRVRFDKLNEMVPYVVGPKKHVVTMSPYNAVVLGMPGRHQHDTPVAGADFVVMLSDENVGWISHQFTHTDLFVDLETKVRHDPEATAGLMELYLNIVRDGLDPEKVSPPEINVGIHPQTFLYGVQALAVAEHRRYAKFEAKFGGRYLPFRFGAGIVEGLWGATDATAMQRRGRPGVEILEKLHGTPTLTKELINA